jgi:hypothetical protein
MQEIISKLSEPEVVMWLLGCLSSILYLTGRITKKQFIAEQKKQKGLIGKWEAKNSAASEVVKPITKVIKLLNYVPVVNTKIPIINKSIPDVATILLEGPIGFLGDLLHNTPGIGTNVNKK